MAKVIKQVHPDYIAIYRVGVFYNVYGKDSYIMSEYFGYMMKNTTENIPTCGFSKKIINKVKTRLEDKKVNYLIIEPRNNYDVEEKSDNGNLNTYKVELQKAYQSVNQRKEIQKVKEKLELYLGTDKFKTIIRKVEDAIDEI